MTRYCQFDTVPLPNGASAVCLDLVEGTEPPVWIVEIFNAEGSMGDGVTDMREGPEGLVPMDSDELAEILRKPPNLLEPSEERMNYEVDVSFNDLSLGDGLAAGEIAIAKLPWVVTARGDLGKKLASMPVGAIGSLDETMGGQTTKHTVKVRSVEDLGGGRMRVTYDPVLPPSPST